MSKKLRVLILPLLILAMLFAVSACSSVKTDAIAVNPNKAFKTAYVVGEEFDGTGLTLIVTYTNEEKEELRYTDIRQEVALTGFSTEKAGRFTATVHFRKKTADFVYTVTEEANSSTKFQVTFQSNGGSEVPSQEIPLYGSVSVPESPTMEGYQFDGWFKESTLINTWDFATEKITEDVTLYAKWAKLYTITFTSPQSGEPDIIRRVKAGGALTDVPAVPEISGMNGSWDRNSFSNIRSDLTVTAVYTQRTFHVGFYDVDENKDSVTLLTFDEVPYGTELFKEEPYKSQIEAMLTPSNSPNKHFVGWSENENLRVTEAVYIYARYETDEHTVTYYANITAGETPFETQQVPYGTPATRPTDPERDGYAFGGWYKESDCRREWVFRNERVLTDTELYAKWIPIYVLKFYADDVEIPEYELQVLEGASLTMDQIPEVPAKVGCNGVWNRTDFVDIRRSDRIDAVYTASTFTVEFRANGETLQVDGESRQTVEYGHAAVVPATVPSVRGRTFAGWDKEETEYTFVTSDLIVNAVYTTNSYSVTYWSHLENGAVWAPISVQFGSPLAEPTAPSREKYVFEGWYREDTFTTKWDFGVDVVEEDLVLYAKYISQYYIDFYDFNGVSVKHMEVPEDFVVNQAEIPAPPTLPGKRVVWFDDNTGKELDLRNPIKQDHSFRPREMGDRVYEIIYTVNGEQAASLTASYGEAVPVPDQADVQIPTGMEFVAWKPNPEGMTVTDDIVFEAELKRQTYTVLFVSADYKDNPVASNVFVTREVQHGGTAYQPTENSERWEQGKEGYQFIGWSETTTNVVRDMVIYAEYRIKVFTVSFVDRETNETYYSYELEYQGQIKYPEDRENPSKRGYTFTGWSDGYNTHVRSDMIIYAEFERTVYVITFESEGGSAVEALRLPYQTVVRRPADPVYEGKAFLGWFTDENKSVKYVFDRPADEDVTLYAGWADYVEGSEGIAYSLNAARTGYEAVYSDAAYDRTHIVIQNYINELPVVGIGYGAFRNFVNLRSIFIPDTVEYISPNAFKGCTNLTASTEGGKEFTLPMGVKRIGANAFEDAERLETLLFAERSQLEAIDEFAFADCDSLKEFTLPEGVKEIGRGAFSDCRSLRIAVLPASLELVRSEAFARNPKLKYVSFQKAVPPNLDTGVFANAPASFHIYVPTLDEYRNVNVSQGWKEVSERLYSNYYLTLDKNWAYSRIGTGGGRTMNIVQYLGTETTVTIPQTMQDASGSMLTVASVDAYAFDSGIEGITFNSDIALNENAFGGATNLKYLGIILKAGLHSDLSAVLRRAYNELPLLNTLGVTGNAEDGTELVTLRVLFGNSAPPAGLEKVRVLEGGNNVIIERMFENCNTLKEVEIAASVVRIGANAFHGASALERVVYLTDEDGNYGLTEIGANAFDGCISLTDPAVPNTVKIVGQDAFRRTQWLTDLEADDARDNDYVIVGDGILYRYLGTDGSVLNMPDEIKSVGAYAFYNNTEVYGVVFGEDSALEIIRESAFESAVNLEYVVLPASLQAVERRVFYNAEKLMKILVFGNTKVEFGAQSVEGTAKGGKLYVYAGHSEVNLAAGVEVCSYQLEFYANDYRNIDWVITRGAGGGMEAVQYVGGGNGNNHVEVPRSVRAIHPYAFYRKVWSVALPVTATLSDDTFGGVTELSLLSLIPTGTPEFNGMKFAEVFNNNPYLYTIRVGGQLDLASLLGGTHDNLRQVIVAEGTTELYRGMFRGFKNLKTIEYEDASAVTKIGANAFDDTAWIAEQGEKSDFVIVNGILVAYLGSDRVVTLPDDVRLVNDGVFRENLTLGFLIMNHKMEIGESAFLGAANLNIIWMKEGSVPEVVGTGAFQCGSEGRILYVPAGESSKVSSWWSGEVSEAPLLYASRDGEENIALVTLTGETDANGNQTARLVRYLKGDGLVPLDRVEMETEQGAVTLTEIGNNALLRDTVTVILPLVGLNLRPYAFYNLSDVQELVLLGTDTGKLDEETARYLFEHNKGLHTVEYRGDQKLATVLSGAQNAVRTVRISEGATHIADFALEGFGSVENVVIPESVLDAGTYALEETAWYQNGSSFVVFPSGYLYKYKGSLLRNPSVPASVKTVGKYAFSRYQKSTNSWTGDSAIEEIQFNAGSTARTILPYAFYGLSSLRYVDIPDSMWEIDPSAFDGTQIHVDLDGVLSVRGRYSATTIVRYTGNATEFTVPASVNKIAAGAFSGNETLQTVTFANTDYNKVTLCDRAFENCVNLETVVWHSKITEVGGWVFAGTAWMANEKANPRSTFVARNNILLAYVGEDSAFALPSYIEVVTADAFPATLKVLTMQRNLPPSIADGALDSVETVYVPTDALELYRAQYPKYADKFTVE